MLVLSRTKDKSVVIRVPPSSEMQEIKVMVSELRGDKARLGFAADRAVTVHREEIQRAVDTESSFV